MVERLVVLLVAGCGRIGFDTGVPLDGSVDGTPFDASGWSELVPLDVVNPTSDELRDVPILVRLDSSRIDYTRTLADGRDLRFTAGNVELAHEIERWVPGGVSIVWVRVPILAPSPARTTFAMHYGNPMATALPGEATWSADHVGVYHFNEGVQDATSTHLDAQLVRGSLPVFDDLLGQALDLESANAAYAIIENVGALDELVTFSGWVRSKSTSTDYEAMIAWPLQGTSEDSPFLGFDQDRLFFQTVDESGSSATRTMMDLWPRDTWVHMALVSNGTSVDGYVDGQPRAAIILPTRPLRPTMPLLFGADCDSCPLVTTDPTSDFLDGAIDEIRLERVARSSAWFAVQYASMRDTLIAW